MIPSITAWIGETMNKEAEAFRLGELSLHASGGTRYFSQIFSWEKGELVYLPDINESVELVREVQIETVQLGVFQKRYSVSITALLSKKTAEETTVIEMTKFDPCSILTLDETRKLEVPLRQAIQWAELARPNCTKGPMRH